MWRNNKTSAWLDEQSPEKKEQLFTDARKSASTWIFEQHKQRQADVIAKKKARLEEKHRKKELEQQKEESKHQELVTVTNTLAASWGGIWSSEEVIAQKIAKLAPDSIRNAVLLQLSFHKLSGSKDPKQYYFQQETRAGGIKRVFDNDQLICHLKEIVSLNNLDKCDAGTSNSFITTKESFEVTLLWNTTNRRRKPCGNNMKACLHAKTSPTYQISLIPPMATLMTLTSQHKVSKSS